jgi:hypothetical protein
MMAKLDITADVYGKFDENCIHLFCHEQPIGHMTLDGNIQSCEMSKGFMYENHRFYKEEEPVRNVDHYVENCDEGWC